MNRKTIIASVAALAVLASVTIWLMLSLFSDRQEKPSKAAQTPKFSAPEVLAAVPSDAVAVFLFDGSSKAERLLADSTGILGPLVAPGSSPSFMKYVSTVGKYETAVSLHNSGTLVPLVVTGVRKTDSLSLAPFVSAAVSAGLKTRVFEERRLLLASTSETLLSTALRHLDTGMSVLDTEGFTEALSRVDSYCRILVSGLYSGKIFQVYAPLKRKEWADFFKAFSLWNSLGISAVSDDGFSLSGSASVRDEKYLHSFASQSETTPAFGEVLPSSVKYAVSISLSDFAKYAGDHSVYRAARFGKSDVSSEPLERAGLSEVVLAGFPFRDSLRRVVLMHTGKDLNIKGIAPNTHGREMRILFGDMFYNSTDTLMKPLRGGWTLMGDAPSIEAFSSLDLSAGTLKEWMASSGTKPLRQGGVSVFLSADGSALSGTFSKPVADALKVYAGGMPLAPVVISAGMKGGVPSISLAVKKMKPDASSEQVPAGVGLVIPEGPFKVMNSSTGKENTLYQNSHLSICLRDETGKDQWGVPFKEKIAGMVRNVDFYNNGRLQFLFAAGSKLYLFDRLGRIVTGFPVDTGKKIILGPEVYDFTGAKGYRAMVIHEDNTVELYNLHGQRPDGWKGIAPSGSVTGMPVLRELESVRYWFVPTSAGEKIYPFLGGEPLSDKEAAKLLKRTKTK